MQNNMQADNQHRKLLIEWLYGFRSSVFNFNDDIITSAIYLYDSYASSYRPKVSEKQVIGLTCLWIASKFNNDKDALHIKELVKFIDGSYNARYYRNLELKIIKTLDWNVAPITPCYYVKLIAEYVEQEKRQEFF